MENIDSHYILIVLLLINKDSIDYYHINSYYWLYKFANVLHFAETKIYANDLICIDTECNAVLFIPRTLFCFVTLQNVLSSGNLWNFSLVIS